MSIYRKASNDLYQQKWYEGTALLNKKKNQTLDHTAYDKYDFFNNWKTRFF